MIAAPYVTDDPAVLGRMEFVIALIAGAVIIEVVVIAAITRDRRHHRAREAAVNARIARRYRGEP